MYFQRLNLITILTIACCNSAICADDPTPTTIRETVAKSLPYIAERGQWWMDSKKCVSCHRTAFTIWTHAAARDAGFEVDSAQLHKWVDWSFEALLKRNDKDVMVGTLNLDGVAQTLYATRTLSLAETQTDQRMQLLQLLQAGQQADGSWKPAGQLPSQKRPATETTFVTTAWNRWLGRAAGLDDSAADKALAFLDSDGDMTSTESLVVQLIDRPEKVQPPVLDTILDEQNGDGGWGWIREQNSDVLATGQVLYAISTQPHDDKVTAAIKRARAYLMATQQPDGSWAVKGTKKNKQDKIQETATYWGTCWAVIGLLESEKVR